MARTNHADIEMLGVHCPKHGAGANKISIVKYPNGDRDYFCWCGNQLAYQRDGKLYVREEVA